MSSSEAIVVLTTAGSSDEATSIANLLVESRLVACVQIIPQIESIYRWEGQVTRDMEWLLLCKTTRDRYPDVEDAIRTTHSYTTPEIIAVDIRHGSASYLDWLRQTVL